MISYYKKILWQKKKRGIFQFVPKISTLLNQFNKLYTVKIISNFYKFQHIFSLQNHKIRDFFRIGFIWEIKFFITIFIYLYKNIIFQLILNHPQYRTVV